MNTYKKTLLTLSLSLTAMQAYGLTSNEIKGFIANEVIRPFQSLGAHNLFNQPIPKSFFDNLANSTTFVKMFIETTGKKDGDLMKTFINAQNATDTLSNGIKICYQALKSNDYKVANAILSRFIDIENNMKTTMKTLNNVTFFFAGKKEARDILATYIELLMFISKKAQLDIVSKLPKPE